MQGWLLLLPAAVLLVTFTHYPVAATLYHSFFSNPKPGASRRCGWGLDNYRAMVEDPVFWQVAREQRVVRGGDHSGVDRAGAADGDLGERRASAGRSLLRLAFFTPTVLPMIAVANIWLFFYTPGYGLLEQITGLLGLPSHNWLGSRETALGCLVGGRRSGRRRASS